MKRCKYWKCGMVTGDDWYCFKPVGKKCPQKMCDTIRVDGPNPKPRLKRVKAWMFIHKRYRVTLASIHKDEIYHIPCTITYNPKDVAGRK